MVQLVIRIPGDPSGCLEWTIIELQGDLETRHGDDLSGKPIGNLQFNHKGVPILIIGHHILYGKTVKMEKPFAVLEKVQSPDVMDTGDGTPHTSYNVKAVVSQKLIFKTRPKPIIANVPKKI